VYALYWQGHVAFNSLFPYNYSVFAQFPMKKHRFLKLIVLYTLLSLASLYFLVPGFSSQLALYTHADNYIAVGILMHNIKAISSLEFSNLYHFPIFYPYSYTLTAGVNFFSQSLLLTPFYLCGIKNVYTLYNLMLLFSLILGGFAVYYVTRYFIKTESLSLTAGALYIFLPMKQINYPHPAMLFFPLSIFAVFFLFRYMQKYQWTDAFFFYVFLFLQALSSLSLFFLTALFCVVLFLISLVIKRKIPLKNIAQLSIGLILLAVFILAVFYPYISNPLNISYQQQNLRKAVLISSLDFYSSWFPLTFKFLRGRPSPLYLGIIASFLIFYFFYSKTEKKYFQSANYALLALLVLPVFFVFWRAISLENLYKMLDAFVICMVFLFVLNALLIWKHTSMNEKILLGGMLFTFISYFKALFRFVPFKYNFLSLIASLVPQINRLKGEWKLRYYFIFLWILLAFLGYKALVKSMKDKKRKTILIALIGVLVLFENFPPPVRTGPLLEHNASVKNLYSKVTDFPDYYGVLELPHYKGGWNDLKIYSLMTLFHNKHIYNGYYGVGVYDPLDIFKRGYFHPAENIPRDIADEKIIHYLRDNGVKIIIFHKSMLVIGHISGKDMTEKTQRVNRIWSDVISGFKKAGQMGLLSKVEVLPEGIVGVIAEKRKGKSFLYQLPYYSLKSKKYIRLDLEKTNPEAVRISIKLNGKSLYEDRIEQGEKQLAIAVPDKKTLKARGNQLEIKSTEEIIIHEFSLSASSL